MATHEVSDGTRTTERWTNSGTPGYYAGDPLVRQRDLTPEEAAELGAVDAATAELTTAETIRQQAADALVGNRTYIAAAAPSTTATRLSALEAQVKTLTRQNQRLIRLAIGLLDGVE